MNSQNKPKMGGLFGGELSSTFLGLPSSLEDGEFPDMVLLGAPVATPYVSVGSYCHQAPAAIRSAFGWPGVLSHHDFDLGGTVLTENIRAIDVGDLDLSDHDFASNRQTIRQSVVSILEQGAVPLVLGGDDSVPIPVLQAYEGSDSVTVLQFDAHIDWRDEVTGEKLGLSSNMRRASEMPWVENIIQVGARGMGSARPKDYQDAQDWGVKFFPMGDIDKTGSQAVLDAIPEGADVYIALDIDVMDPSIVPAVIGPAPGGMDYWLIIDILKQLAEKNRIVGFNLVELMTENDINGRGALVAARIVAVLMGLISRQRASEN